MSRITRKEQPPPATTGSATIEKEEKQKSIVESAFESILNAYSNEYELLKALASARSKVRNLEAKMLDARSIVSSMDVEVATIRSAVARLNQKIGKIGYNNDTVSVDREGVAGSPETLKQLLPRIEMAVVESRHYVLMKEHVDESLEELDKARKFVKMLEGAKIVADAGGMKRKREDYDSDDSV